MSRMLMEACSYSLELLSAASKYAKPNNSEVDKELQDFLDSHADYRLISYKEHTEQSGNVLSSSELLEYKEKGNKA